MHSLWYHLLHLIQVHSGPMRFAELDSFVDGVLNGGPLEQKLQAGNVFRQHR